MPPKSRKLAVTSITMVSSSQSVTMGENFIREKATSRIKSFSRLNSRSNMRVSGESVRTPPRFMPIHTPASRAPLSPMKTVSRSRTTQPCSALRDQRGRNTSSDNRGRCMPTYTGIGTQQDGGGLQNDGQSFGADRAFALDDVDSNTVAGRPHAQPQRGR